MGERLCAACACPFSKRSGPGRWPKYCEDCKSRPPLRPLRYDSCSHPSCCNLIAPSQRRRYWCSTLCRDSYRRLTDRAYVEARRAKGRVKFPRRPIGYANCTYCSQLYVVRAAASVQRARACRSAACRTRYHNERAKELRIARKAAGRPLALSPEALDRRRAARSERRARTRGAERVEAFGHVEIFDRDGWRCGICGRKVGKKSYPHPLSATLDHIIPISQGGEHTKANTRCAHYGCNSGRRDRGGDEQLCLIG